VTEQQIFAKCAWRLIPFILLLRLFQVLDRGNVAFASLTMNTDLGFSAAVYGFGASIFFIGYLAFQMPITLLIERAGARRTIFAIMLIWGAMSAGNAFVRGPHSFYTMRFLLGAAEGGFFPGIVFYLTRWFPDAYRARIVAAILALTPFSFMIGGPLSSLILRFDGMAGLHGWQWLFLLEGAPTVVLGIGALFLLPDRPATARWLSSSEKDAIFARLSAEEATKQGDLGRALRDPRMLALAVAFGCLQVADFGLTLWLPQLVRALGFSNSVTGFVVVPPYAAAIIAMFFWSRSSDGRRERIWHTALPALFAAAGFIVAGIAQSTPVMLMAFMIAVMGIFSTYGPFNTIPLSLFGGRALAGSYGLMNSIGTFGGFVGPNLIGVVKEKTGGYGAAMAIIAFALVLLAIIIVAVGQSMERRIVAIHPRAAE
jgi:MFS transporter, ACS family, tartrate transporter